MKMIYLLIALAAITLSSTSNTLLANSHQSPTFNVTEINPALMFLQGKGGNIALSTGEDGLLIIDDDYAEMSSALKREIEKFGGKSQLKFILNTHWHGDHTGSNASLGQGVSIVAHDNVRQRLNTRQEVPFFKMVSEPQPKHALPSLTYLQSMVIYFNNEKFTLQHYPSGHTDGDSVIFLEHANVVHMGDHMFNLMFPFIDIASGGNAVAFTENISSIINQINDTTVVIPGHGPLTDKQGLVAYQQMLEGTISEVKMMKDAGATLEQIQSKGLSQQWKIWNNGFIKEKVWVLFIYNSL
ncbi:MAG: MBL fold metallo-hydrolase [Pseudomonadales bacterium]